MTDFGSEYYSNRLRNLVFGAWMNWTQEQLAINEKQSIKSDAHVRQHQLLSFIIKLDHSVEMRYKLTEIAEKATALHYLINLDKGFRYLSQFCERNKSPCWEYERYFQRNKLASLHNMNLIQTGRCFDKLKMKTFIRLKRVKKSFFANQPIIEMAFNSLIVFMNKSAAFNKTYRHSVHFAKRRRLKRFLRKYFLIHSPANLSFDSLHLTYHFPADKLRAHAWKRQAARSINQNMCVYSVRMTLTRAMRTWREQVNENKHQQQSVQVSEHVYYILDYHLIYILSL